MRGRGATAPSFSILLTRFIPAGLSSADRPHRPDDHPHSPAPARPGDARHAPCDGLVTDHAGTAMTQPPYVPGQQPHPPSPYGQPPVPPGYQPPPPGWAPPQPTKKRGPLVWILGIVGGVVALCLAIGIVGMFTDGNTGGSERPAAAEVGETEAGKPATAGGKTAATKAPAKKIAGIGDKVRDGKFEFVVTKLDCSKTRVGDDFLNAKAQGKFCIVSVSVTNIGDEAQLFTGANQTAYAGKTEFKNDSGAEFYANDDSQTFLEEINPGNSVKGNLVFDVPKTTKLTEIELHDGFFSGGVRVSLF